MEEIQFITESFPAWKAILWCFYPMGIVVAIELIARIFNDDDDQDGGKMIPAMQTAQ